MGSATAGTISATVILVGQRETAIHLTVQGSRIAMVEAHAWKSSTRLHVSTAQGLIRIIVTLQVAQAELQNKGRFCNNSEIDTLISKRLSVENKVKLSQLARADFVTIAKLTHYFKAIICREQSETLN